MTAGAALGAVTGVPEPEVLAAPEPPREIVPELVVTAPEPLVDPPDVPADERLPLESRFLMTSLVPRGETDAVEPLGRRLGAGAGATLGAGAGFALGAGAGAGSTLGVGAGAGAGSTLGAGVGEGSGSALGSGAG